MGHAGGLKLGVRCTPRRKQILTLLSNVNVLPPQEGHQKVMVNSEASVGLLL